MRILKSVGAGVAALFVTAIAAIIVFIVALSFMSRDMPTGYAIGWDPISLMRNSIAPWIVLFTGFVVGFVWQYRRDRGRTNSAHLR